jgi:GNAT superfamily N-acetyltransferase
MTGLFVPRDATPDDYEHFVTFFRELGTDDAVPSRESWLSTRMPRTLFLEREGHVVAYAMIDVLEGTGYIRHVVVDPAVRRGCVGRALMSVIGERLRVRGCTRWCLNVKDDNVAARALYERVGMTTAYESVAFKFLWAYVERLPRATTAAEIVVPQPEKDGAVETRFDLPRGMLAGFRATPGHMTFVLRDRDTGTLVGVTRFVPETRRAVPFRVVRPDLAAALLDALRPHARPGHESVTITVEDDAELARVIEATGAPVTMRLLHMRGEVPG